MERRNQEHLEGEVVGERGGRGRERNGLGHSEEWCSLKKKIEEEADLPSSTFSLSVSSYDNHFWGVKISKIL